MPGPALTSDDGTEARRLRAAKRTPEQQAVMDAYVADHKSRPATTMSHDEQVADLSRRAKASRAKRITDLAVARGAWTQATFDPDRDPDSDVARGIAEYGADTQEMIRRKDRQALRQTGSTSADRNAQTVSRVGEAVHTTIGENGGTAKAVDKFLGGPVLETGEAIGLAMDAQGALSAQRDGARQEAARRTKKEAATAHAEGHDALEAMRASRTGPGEYAEGTALAANAAAGRTVMAHNRARRDALAAGQDMLKPMSVDHSVGEAVPIPVEDGTVIDASLGDQARAHKDALKEKWSTEESELQDAAKKRKGGWFTKADPEPEWEDRMAANAEERKSLTAANKEVDASAGKRREYLNVNTKGYKYGLTKDEADAYHPARDAYVAANDSIEEKHKAHVAGIQSQLDELTQKGLAQKDADRHRSGKKDVFGRPAKEAFSKKNHLIVAERDLTELRTKQTNSINQQVAILKGQHKDALKSGSKVEQQRLADQIAKHERMAAQSRKKGSSFVAEGIPGVDTGALHSAMSRAQRLRMEKTTGLTADQQKAHAGLRARLDAAKANPEAGADTKDIETRDEHQDTVDHYRFIKTHGMTPDEHDEHLENEQRILEIKKEEKTGLSTDESARLDDISHQRQVNKGLVKRSRAFAKKHEGETVWQGRAGGVGASYREDRAETSDADARAEKINAGARTTHRVGTVMNADLDDSRAAMESGDLKHARNIAASRAVQNIADAASSAAGGPAIGMTVQTTGKVVRAGADIVGGLTHEGADNAKFAQHARAMTVGPDGKTDRYHTVQNSVLDFHGDDDGAFEGGVKKGARQLLGMGREAFGGDISSGLSDAVSNSGAVNAIADAGASLASHAQPVADTVAQTAGTVVDQTQDGAHEVLGKVHKTISDAAEHLPESGIGAELGVGAAVGNLVQGGHDALAAHVDETSDSAREAISDNLEGLSDGAHDAITGQAASTTEDLVEGGFDKADEALRDHPEEPEVIGNSLGPKATPEPTPEPDVPAPSPEPTPGPTPGPSPAIVQDLDADRPAHLPYDVRHAAGMPAKLPWWKRMWNSVKRGARAVRRGISSAGRRIRSWFS
jgi:hypothetical protein